MNISRVNSPSDPRCFPCVRPDRGPCCRLGEAGVFTLDVVIPQLSLVADYSSAGVLIMIPASGRGTLHGELGRVRTLLRGSAAVRGGAVDGDVRHAHVDRLLVDLKVADVSMRIERAAGDNFIIGESW